MGDENFRKPTSARATRVGLGAISYSEHERDYEAEDRYMDPPSETYGMEREEIVRRLREDTEANAARAEPAEHAGPGLFGSTLHAHSAAHAATGRAPVYDPRDAHAPTGLAPAYEQPAATAHRAYDTRDAHATTGLAPTYDPRVAVERGFAEERSHSGHVEQGLLGAALEHTLRPQPVAAAEPSFEPQYATPAQPMASRPLTSSSRAPESWRDEVRRMVERGPMKNPPPAPPGPSAPSGSGNAPGGYGSGGAGGYGGGSYGGGGYGGAGGGGGGDPRGGGGPTVPGGIPGPGAPAVQHKPSLRLQLDAGYVEDVYRAPKSVVPKLLIWLAILLIVGGATAYIVSNEGLLGRSTQQVPTLEPAATPPAATPMSPSTNAAPQPPAAAAPAGQAPPAAASPSAAVPSQPAQAAQPTQAPQPAAAAPSAAPAEQPAAADEAKQPAAAAPAAQEKPPAAAKPAPKPAAPRPARAVRRQDPVVKVRPMDETSTSPVERGAAEPVEPPYVPVPGDPPAPDAP